MEIIIKTLYRLRNWFQDNTHFGRTAHRITIRIAHRIINFADFLDELNSRGFKYVILKYIWNFLRNLDKGESYEGETAPYCGHHYSGFENKYITSSYHEGDGGGETKFSILGYKLYQDNIDEQRFYISK